MKNFKFFGFIAMLMLVLFSSCERVAPNFQGVLMENYGKNGKSDFTLQKGRVWTASPGAELFQVPFYELRGDYGDRVIHLKSADNTDFSSRPMYSFKAIENRCVDLVFQNKQLGSNDDFMITLMDNILETKIYDIMKEVSKTYTTQTLMETTVLPDGTTTSGSLIYEKAVQEIVRKEFESKGLELVTFSCQLEFTAAVTAKIDSRNEVNTNISVIEQKVAEAKAQLELERITAEIAMVPLVVAKKNGVIDEYIKLKAYEAWTKATIPLYGSTPFSLLQK
jgi:disulfide oxidoreductase YuzD